MGAPASRWARWLDGQREIRHVRQARRLESAKQSPSWLPSRRRITPESRLTWSASRCCWATCSTSRAAGCATSHFPTTSIVSLLYRGRRVGRDRRRRQRGLRFALHGGRVDAQAGRAVNGPARGPGTLLPLAEEHPGDDGTEADVDQHQNEIPAEFESQARQSRPHLSLQRPASSRSSDQPQRAGLLPRRPEALCRESS